MDAQQAPSAASQMPYKVKGECVLPFRRNRLPERENLNTPDLMVHEPGAASQGSAAFFRPPLTPFVPAHRIGAHRKLPAPPMQLDRLASSGADNVYGLTEHPH
jgi:hypothetical protein